MRYIFTEDEQVLKKLKHIAKKQGFSNLSDYYRYNNQQIIKQHKAALVDFKE